MGLALGGVGADRLETVLMTKKATRKAVKKVFAVILIVLLTEMKDRCAFEVVVVCDALMRCVMWIERCQCHVSES
jgi:hypothetical protein